MFCEKGAEECDFHQVWRLNFLIELAEKTSLAEGLLKLQNMEHSRDQGTFLYYDNKHTRIIFNFQHLDKFLDN